MKITIHRGAKQIGGVVVEIRTTASRVFIDIGDDLPGTGAAPFKGIDGLTRGDSSGSVLFLTHYHGDHIGRLASVLPDVPVYMGETAKKILINLVERVNKDKLPLYEKIITFKPAEKIVAGDISVVPLMIDHSAFDAYMFVVEADGKRVLHTGDFRTHGFRGPKTSKMLSVYAKDVDFIISEGTMLSRPGGKVTTENDLKTKAKALMCKNKYTFALCSSTNIDRIAALYHASQEAGRLFVCDYYQAKQLEAVREAHAGLSSLYDFRDVYSVGYFGKVPLKLLKYMDAKGFCMLIRKGKKFKPYLDLYGKKSFVIYSMWTGYLSGAAADPKLADFLSPYSIEELHASGHATAEALKEIYNTVQPKSGLIPIHSENPEGFGSLIGEKNVILLSDGEVYDA